MNFFSKPPADLSAQDFDSLRVRLETEVTRPTVVAITASTAVDGKNIASRSLARSIAIAGYSTLFIDACAENRKEARFTKVQTLLEAIENLAPDVGQFTPTVLILDDAIRQRTSQRDLLASLETLRGRFEYIVIDAEIGLTTPFATSIMALADAVIVIIRKGRRQAMADRRLSESLDRIGDRFLGILALHPDTIDASTTGSPLPETLRGGRVTREANPVVT